MEIKAWLFFSLWALISLTFLKLAFNALDRTHLSSSTPPIVMFLFKHAFAISVSHSCDYTFVHCKQVQKPDDRYHTLIAVALLPPLVLTTLGGPVFVCFMYAVPYSYEIAMDPVLSHTIVDGVGIGVDFFVKLTMLCFGGRTRFVPLLVLLIASYTSTVWAAITEEQNLYEMLPDEENASFLNKKKTIERVKLVRFGVRILGAVLFRRENQSSSWRRILRERRKLIEFMIGMMGTILFQNFFRLTTFDHVLAFMFLAVAWLGNLALLRASGDLGVFNFLLGNVIVGCTVSQFGLRGTTWLAYGASVVLYGLRLKLENLALVERGEEARVIVW